VEIGDSWNESELRRDPLTGRRVRRLTTRGRINQTPTYHTNSGFSADGRYLAFVSVREAATWVLRAEPASGRLKALWRAPGIGDRSYIHRGMGLEFPDVDGRGICGNRLCVGPRSGVVVFTCQRSLYAVEMDTCGARTLLADCGPEWIFGAPCLSPDEGHVVIALSSAHPELLAGKAITRGYRDFPDHALRLIRVGVDGAGRAETLYERRPAQSAHCAFCPTDGRRLYFDLDLPPGYWGGGDGKTPRIWLLDLSDGSARPIKARFPGPFQVHQTWLWDGSGIAYHGGLPGGGEYFGIVSIEGETVWERAYTQAGFYGHHTPDARRPALIIDGHFSGDLLQWLHYDDRPGQPGPKLEPICVHGTEWGGLPGQYSHPHPLTDASGRWISFTAAKAGRSDVFVVEVE